MSHENNIIKAPVNILDDLGYVLGTNSGDLGTNCVSSAVKKYALYKPIKHTNLGYVTMADRINCMHSLVPKELSTIRTHFFGSSNYFTTVPTPTAWGYDKPTGGSYPYRAFDFLHIESDLTKIATDWGYNHNMEAAPLSKPTIPNPFDITNDSGPYDIIPIFNYDGTDANSNANNTVIELLLNKILFKGYSGWATILNDNLYDDIFGGRYRFGVALALKIDTNKYQWCVVGSPDFLTTPFKSLQDASVIRSHAVRLAYDSNVLNSIKNMIRKFGQTSITCVPFLGVNLYYNAQSQLPNKWAFNGETQLAITFPDGDYFTINPDTTKFPITINVNAGFITGHATFRAAYTTTNNPAQSISGLTWYNGTAVSYSGKNYVALMMPAPPSASHQYIITEMVFTITSHFDTSFDFSGGLFLGSSSQTCALYYADGTAVTDGSVSGEWSGENHTFIIRSMSPLLYNLLNGPDQTFPKRNDDDGADLYFSNGVVAPQGSTKLHKINLGYILNKQS